MSNESEDTKPVEETPVDDGKNANLKKIGAAMQQFGSKVVTVTKDSAVKAAAATKEFDSKYQVSEKAKDAGQKVGTWISGVAANVKEKAANSKLLHREKKEEGGKDESDA
jgi:hypothetical protein